MKQNIEWGLIISNMYTLLLCHFYGLFINLKRNPDWSGFLSLFVQFISESYMESGVQHLFSALVKRYTKKISRIGVKKVSISVF